MAYALLQKLSIDETSLNNTPRKPYCCSLAVCNPERSGHRYFALIFLCFIGLGNYFCYDAPGALQKQIIHDMRVSTFDFSTLYAWCSWPNVIQSFVGGFLIDKIFGMRLGAVIFGLFTLTGQLVFALGATVNKFWMMKLGRFLFGLGQESLGITQNAYAVKWFKGKELNMVFGLQLSLGRMGATANFLFTPSIYNFISQYLEGGQKILGATLFVVSVTCMISLMSALIMGFLDWRAEKVFKRSPTQSNKEIHLSDIKNFPCSFWLITAICITYYGAIFPFVGLGSMFFAQKYHLAQSSANSLDSFLYIIAGIAPPAIGIMIDKTGRNLTWVFTAVFFTLVSHILLGLTSINPWMIMIIFGFSYATLASSLWPMVPLVVPEHQLGTAYGIMLSIENLGLGLVSMATGAIVDYRGYIFVEIFFIYCVIACVMFVVTLYIINERTQGCLNLTVSAKEVKRHLGNDVDVPEKKKLLESDFITETDF